MKKTAEHLSVLTVNEENSRGNTLKGKNTIEIDSIINPVKSQSETYYEYSFDEIFPIVRVSSLSLHDYFLEHNPKTFEQKRLKKSILEGIKAGLPDFRHPIMDPSFDESGNLVYVKGNKPAVKKSAIFWQEKFKKFMPEKNSRLATLRQYDLFLGLLIKNLIEEGFELSLAWESVCENSIALGHYWDSKDSKYDFEPTGSRKVCSFYDLANTRKIVVNNNSISDFLLVSGRFNTHGYSLPLSDVQIITKPKAICNYSLGLLVLDV